MQEPSNCKCGFKPLFPLQSKELVSQGVEVVEADINDEKSLRSALKDAYAVFAVTNFW